MEEILPPLTDLCSITRQADRVRTTVSIQDDVRGRDHEWIRCGLVDIQRSSPRLGYGNATISALLTEGVTDYSYDSAYAFKLDLIGFEFDCCFHNNVEFTGWIKPEGMLKASRRFHVPNPGYDPAAHKDAYRCEKHNVIIVPEGMFLPPANPELYSLVQGKMVRVSVRPIYEGEVNE